MVRVFGGMGIEVGGDPVSIGGPRQRRLLALLVVRSGSVVTHDWLAEHLWTDSERPSETIPPLRTYLSRLRHSLPKEAQSWIETEAGGWRFALPLEAAEHKLFESLRASATSARGLEDPLSAIGFLDRALALWRGDPFPELEDFDWARSTVEQLRLDRLEMLEERWEVSLALGRHTQITGELAAFTAEHGLRDRAVRQHALALHRSGRTTEALRVLDEHRRTLAEQSGLEPSPAVIELETSLFAGDSSLDVEKVGRPLRGYRLLEEIGNGAFSVVWRGVQPSVGRDVAIKQIRSELATQPEFIRRFEAEAHLVASIEHPHVVPLIDFWRDPDSAYLVMRWLRGGTLERRLDDGPLSPAMAIRLARHVGGALSSAHSQGIVHCDVKPANILFDHEGNAFLTDFGIALEVSETSGPEAALSPGSPAYAAPEQIRHEQLGPEADVFSLGVVLSECLGPDAPASMTDAVSQATAEDLVDRFASIDEFLIAFAPAGSQLAISRPGEKGRSSAGPLLPANPYKGLRAFDHGDGAVFFGRERLTHELVSRLSSNSIEARCLVVVGPSGSGKSSVVRAGVVPAVRAGAIEGSAEWFTSTMVPGTDPYESLEAALLRVAVNPPASLLEQLRDGHRGVLRCVRRCLGSDDARVLLTIDQFEELFTGPSAEQADRFLDALALAVNDPTSPLRLIITIRADYYDRPLAHPTFAPIVKACAVDVTPLAGDELERAIVEPARHMGVEFEPGLVARIAGETSGQPAALPLLQYTLSELFDRRSGSVLTAEAYDDVGGLTGALAARAEAIFDESDESQRLAIRRIFGRMTDPSGESADVRRRVPLADIGDESTSKWVLDRFGEARLVTFDRDVSTREPTVEVAHEALLREWPRLVSWLAEDLEVLRSAALVATAANAWDQSGRVQSDVYRGWRLDNAVQLALEAPDRLRSLDMEFIAASRATAESTQQAERRRVRRLRRLVAGVGVALIIALIAGGLAFRQSNRADDQARRAEESASQAEAQSRIAQDQTQVAESQTAAALRSAEEAELATLISRSAAQIGGNPDIAVLLALEAHRRSPRPETDNAVLNALGSNTFVNRVASLEPLNDPAGPCPETLANSDGTIEFGVVDGDLVSRDPLTGVVNTHGRAPVPCVLWLDDSDANRRVAFADDGRRMWLGPSDGPWDVVTDFDVPTVLISRSFNETNRLLVESQGAAQRGVVVLLDDETGEVVGDPVTGGLGFVAADASDDGSLIAASFSFNVRPEGLGEIVIADGRTGEELLRFDTTFRQGVLALDKTSGELVSGTSESASITTFDVVTGEIVAEVQSNSTSARPKGGLSLRSDGLLVAVSRNQIELIDRLTGAIGEPVRLPSIIAARARPDGSVLTFSAERRATIVDPQRNALVEKGWPIGAFDWVNFADGRAAVLGEPGADPEIINLETGERATFELISPEGEPVVPERLIPDVDGFWAWDLGSFLRRWEGGSLVASVRGGPYLAGGRYGDLFAGGTVLDGFPAVDLVDLDSEVLRVVLTVPAPSVATTHPTRDRGLHIVDRDGTLHTYDSDGVRIGEMAIPQRDVSPLRIAPGWVVRFPISMDSDSGRLAMPGVFGEALIVDPASGEVWALPDFDSVNSVTYARRGELLVISSNDGTVSLWDVGRDQSAGTVWTGTGAGSRGIPWYDESTDSLWVATAQNLVEIPLDPATWVERSCGIVGRDFTQDEWDRFVPGDQPLQSACS